MVLEEGLKIAGRQYEFLAYSARCVHVMLIRGIETTFGELGADLFVFVTKPVPCRM